MEDLLNLLDVVMHWRLALAVLVSVVVAVVLAIHIAPFTGGYGVALVCIGTGAGLWWDSSASVRR